ncbi:hypothetical protein [Paenibacillus harenae]|uniref:hypothetical protein n=1 Tax=Paenibacillus harenae TaxID=306543 RepID=UPI00048B6077|nr:hypothetical protein [Paenibacillus harenae]
MIELEQVVQRAKSDIAKQYVFVHMPIPQLETLLSGLEEAQREIERLKKSNNDMWDCPDCGFAFDSCHVDVDTNEHSCPVCCEAELTKENNQLRTEHTAMKEALEWYTQHSELPLAHIVLASLTKEQSNETPK